MMKRLLLLLALAPLAGCPVPQDQNTPVPQRQEIEPVTGRSYYIYVPSTYRKDQPCPLIVTCHGTPPYDIAEHHIREWKMLGEQNRCIVLAPVMTATDGIIGDGPVVGMLDDERYIMSLLRTLGHQYNIDLANVMITGFSGGGFPAYWVGFRHPDLFSTVVARSCNFSETNLAGWYAPEAAAMRVMVYYGENDPGAIRGQSDNAIRYLRGNGFVVETTVIPGIGHERRPEYAMEFFRKNWRTPRPSLPQETR